MTASPQDLGRLLHAVGSRSRPALLAGALAVLLADYALVRLTGGAPNPLVHFAYLGITLAALGAGWRGGVIAALAAGILLGPLMPDSTAASGTLLGSWGWALRLVAYLAVGTLIGWFVERAEHLAAVVVRRASEAESSQRLAASEARLWHTVEATADGVLAFDAEGGLTLINAAAERLLGVARAEVLGTSYETLAARIGAVQGREAVPRLVGQLETASPEDLLEPRDVELVAEDGAHRLLEVRTALLDASSPHSGYVVTLHDVTAQRVVARERAAHLAAIEETAGLAMGAASSAAAGEALLSEFARAWPVAAAAIYLFTGAHAERLAAIWPEAVDGPPRQLVPANAADALRALAETSPARVELTRLPASRESAASLAQYGARSLLVLALVEQGALVGVLLAGDRSTPVGLSHEEVDYLASIGRLAASVVRRAVADEAAARLGTREQVAAVLADPRLLVPHFQPILSLADRSVAGYEALARFRCPPAQGPDAWFAQATSVGLGAELQALAVSRALEVSQQAGLPPHTFLSLNVSPRFLDSDAVAKALGQGPMRHVVIEVTEEEAVADYGALRAAMAPYLSRGARVAVDDTGAGYASLLHVTELRPSFVKLDAQLIRGLRDDATRRVLLDALVGFADAIGAAAIAEGVETEADLALLARSHRPLLVQGYAVARPGPAWPAIDPRAAGAARSRLMRRSPRVPTEVAGA